MSVVFPAYPSQEAKDRLIDLIEREKTVGLSSDEKSELDHFMELEHLLRMAKAKARQILARGQLGRAPEVS